MSAPLLSTAFWSGPQIASCVCVCVCFIHFWNGGDNQITSKPPLQTTARAFKRLAFPIDISHAPTPTDNVLTYRQAQNECLKPSGTPIDASVL